MTQTSDQPATDVRGARDIAARAEVHSLTRQDYVSAEVFEREVEALLRPAWLFAGHVSQLTEPRDYITLSWRGESAVVLRTDGGELVAHHNVCRHRGFRLFDAPSGRGRSRITCGYHGWCYEQTGQLRTAARLTDERLDRPALSLKPVALEVWNGLVFVSFADTPPVPLAVALDGLDLSRFGLEHAKIAHRRDREFAANWKVVADNVNECYHCTLNHPELSQQLDVHALDSSDEIAVVPNGYLIDGMPLRGVSFTSSGELASRVPFGGAGESPQKSALLGVFPGLLAFCYPDYVSILNIVPVAHDRTALQNTFLVHGAAVEGEDYDVDTLTEMQLTATDQDEELIARAWAGMQSPSFEFGPLHPEYEPTIVEFAAWYRAGMGADAKHPDVRSLS